jgi:hypothetical protein
MLVLSPVPERPDTGALSDRTPDLREPERLLDEKEDDEHAENDLLVVL